MFISLALNHGVLPHQLFEDTDENWRALLDVENVLPGAKDGTCIRPVAFHEDASAPSKTNVQMSYGALFDIDEGVLPTIPQLQQALEGHRFIVWTTYNSTRTTPRLRLLVPYGEQVYPWEHEYLWTRINEVMLGGLCDEKQRNIDRLGYLPRLDPARGEEARQAYAYLISPGERLLPKRRFGIMTLNGWELPPEEISFERFVRHEPVSSVVEPDKTNWYSDEETKNKARIYFQNVGPGIAAGGRHAELFKISCKLWWDFWLEWDDVFEVLSEINTRFPEPKSALEIVREVEAGYVRTRGSGAVVQRDADGEEKAAGCFRERPPVLTQAQIENLAQIEKRSRDSERKEIGQWLLRLFPDKNGRPQQLAGPEDRDRAVRTLVRFFAEKCPSHDPQGLADHFAAVVALEHGQSPWATTVATIKAQITQAQARQREEQEAKEAQANEALCAAIRSETNGKRSTPYSEEEIERWCDQKRISRSEFFKRLIIYKGGTYYFFVDGEYQGPYPDTNIIPVAVRKLLPAPGVDLLVEDANGRSRRMTRNEMLERYGTTADEIVADMTAQRSEFIVEDSRTVLTEAPCPIRPDLVPERVPVVEEWLNTIGSERLMKWLQHSVRLNEPLPLLFIVGRRASGKTLLVNGLNRIYRTDDALNKMSLLFDNWNGHLATSPFVIADDSLPSRLKSKDGSETLRELIQERTRPLREKYATDRTLIGFQRLVVLANNKHLLFGDRKTESVFTIDDAEAVAERVVHIELSGEPARYLASLSRSQRDAFRSQDLIAKHVLWMADNCGDKGAARFVVEGEKSSVSQGLLYTGATSDVLEYVRSALEAVPEADAVAGGIPSFSSSYKTRLNQDIFLCFDEKRGEAYVGLTYAGVQNAWGDVKKDARHGAPAKLGRVLENIAIKRVRPKIKERRVDIHLVDPAILEDWFCNVTDGSKEALDDLIYSAFKRAHAQGKVFPLKGRGEYKRD